MQKITTTDAEEMKESSKTRVRPGQSSLTETAMNSDRF